MCILAMAYRCHDDYPVVMLSNRDEFHQRPAAALALWPENGLVAGKDLTAGGTWMGMHSNGRYAAVTNYRSAGDRVAGRCSRGHLVTGLLTAPQSMEDWLGQIATEDYAGFNLMAGTLNQLWFMSNRHGRLQPLAPGLYGLSNGQLNSPWPKVTRARDHLRHLLSTCNPDTVDPYLDTFYDRTLPPLSDLPDTGVGLQWEQLLSTIFIRSDEYGTQATSLLTVRRDGLATLTERRYNPKGEPIAQDAYQLLTSVEMPHP